MALTLALSPLDISSARVARRELSQRSLPVSFVANNQDRGLCRSLALSLQLRDQVGDATMAEILGQVREGEHSRSIPACPFSEPHPTQFVGDTAQWLRYR